MLAFLVTPLPHLSPPPPRAQAQALVKCPHAHRSLRSQGYAGSGVTPEGRAGKDRHEGPRGSNQEPCPWASATVIWP